jgi:cytochrome c oxidase subunit II
MLPPATPDAQLIKNLYDGVYVLAVITFVLVEALLVIAAIKFRRQSNADAPVQTHGNNMAELGWTVVPAIIVAIVFGMAVDTAGKLAGAGSTASPVAKVHAVGDRVAERRVQDVEKVDMVIEVTGRQWFWQYKYKMDGELMTDSNDDKPLVIPAGKRIRLDLTAADVIHAWWVPQLGPMLYVNPGELTAIFIVEAAPGNYIGQCNFYCGVRHAYMLNNVKVMPEAEFDAWYKGELAAAGAVATK